MKKIKFGIFAFVLGISLALMGCETTTGVVPPSDQEIEETTTMMPKTEKLAKKEEKPAPKPAPKMEKKPKEEPMVAKKEMEKEEVKPKKETTIVPAPPEQPRAVKIYQLQTVYFKFDNTDIQDQFKKAIQENFDWIQANPGVKVQLEGHADERGTNEYNLALGERRTKSVLNYLIALGANPEQFTIVSFGEERPAEPGHNEVSWARNRRVEFTRL